MMPIHTILFPTDFSENSASALELACALARDYGAELVIAHVSPAPVPAVADGVTFGLPTGWEEETKAELHAVRPADAKIRFSHQFVIGNPETDIIEMADKVKADLIVMGTHGRRGLSRLLMGSVAEYVMRHATCPVLTVRKPIAATPRAGDVAGSPVLV